MHKIELQGLENGEVLVLEATAENMSANETVSNDEGAESSEYMTVFDSGFENIPENATFMERLAYGGKVTLIGMVTVFLVLIIIWALCAALGKIFGNASESQKNVEDEKPVAPQPAVQPAVNSVDYTTVAVVASAAIAAYRGEDTVTFNISSIKPCGNGAVALAPEVVAQIAASIACLEGKDTVDFTISSIRII